MTDDAAKSVVIKHLGDLCRQYTEIEAQKADVEGKIYSVLKLLDKCFAGKENGNRTKG